MDHGFCRLSAPAIPASAEARAGCLNPDRSRLKSASPGAPGTAGVVKTQSAGRATGADVVVRRIAAHEAPDQGHRIRFVHDLRAGLLVQIRL